MTRTSKILLLFMLICQTACAAGFDCEKASGVIEEKICSEPNLSSLDDDLHIAYHASLDEADKPEVVRKEQKEWLNLIRDKCHSSECIEKAYRKRLSDIKRYPKYAWVAFSNDELGISFSVPSNRTVRVDSKTRRVAVYSYPPKATTHVIEFEVGSGSLTKAAKTTDVFVKKDGKWWSNIGTFPDAEAESINGNGWQGIKATVGCGVFDEESGIHATGECLWAIVSNGSRYVVAHTQGSVEIDDRLLKILSSLSFSQK